MERRIIQTEELRKKVEEIESFRIRLAAENTGSVCVVQHLFAQAHPNFTQIKDEWQYYNYGSKLFLSEIISGKGLAALFKGDIIKLGQNNVKINDMLANVQFQSNKVPKYEKIGFPVIKYPHTRYECFSQNNSNSAQTWLISPNCPIFRDFKEAVNVLLFENISKLYESSNISSDRSIIIEIPDLRAWLEHIYISSTEIKIKVEGQNTNNVKLQMYAPGNFHHECEVGEKKDFQYPLPSGLPGDLRVFLFQGNEWLDYVHFNYPTQTFFKEQENIRLEKDPQTEIQELISRGEGETVEFKLKFLDNKDNIGKVIAAFANGNGGTILLGVEDKTGSVVGLDVDIPNEKDRITNYIKSNLTPFPEIEVKDYEIDKKKLIAIIVEPGNSKPYGVNIQDPRYYVRRGATTFPASPEAMRDMLSFYGSQIYDYTYFPMYS